MKRAERACEDGADRAGKVVCMWTRESETNLTKQREGDREGKREEEVRSVRKMETCNIHEMRVHPDSVHVEGEETTSLMRELEKHGREGKDLVG